MREVQFTHIANSQLEEWKKTDQSVYSRIEKLIDAIQVEPFKGIGKPEPLKHQFKGYWSRRINNEHRLIYKVTANSIIVIACKYHY